MRLAEHVTPNFTDNIRTVVVFLDIEQAVDTAWYSDLLHTFLTSLMKLIASPRSARNCKTQRKGNGAEVSKFLKVPPSSSIAVFT
jgi:hypothetical protein